MIDQAKVRVLLLESIHADAVSRLEAEGYQVESVRNALDEVELIERIPGVHLLGIRSKTKVTAKVLEAADSLVAVGAFCIGTDQIDLANASAAGVAVFNAPFSNTRSVVELALAEIIAMTRRLTEKNELMHRGVWDKAAVGSHEVRGRTLGIVGYGNIGTQLSVLAENLGMHVVVLRHRGQAGARQRTPLQQHGRTARRVGRGDAARGRPAGQRRILRRRAVRPDAPGCHLPEPVPRHRGRPSGVARGAEQRAPVRRGRRRVPVGAEGPGRRVRLRAARSAQCHPHPAHRRVHRGGTVGHRRLRGQQAGAFPRRRATPR